MKIYLKNVIVEPPRRVPYFISLWNKQLETKLVDNFTNNIINLFIPNSFANPMKEINVIGFLNTNTRTFYSNSYGLEVIQILEMNLIR